MCAFDPKTLHILPTAAAVESFTRRAMDGKKVLLGTAALTLRRLAEDIFRVSSDARRPLSRAGKRLLLEEAVRESDGQGSGRLASMARFPGFAGALESFISEMKQALVTPDDLAAARRMPGGERLSELASLFRRFEELLAARNLLDRNDMELAALAHLRSGGPLPPCFEEAGRLCCAGIYDFTALQTALLEELARRLPVEVSFPYDFGRPLLFSYVSKTVDAFEALDNAGLGLELAFAEPERTFLHPLLAALFREEAEGGATPPAGNTALIAAPAPYRECEEIGRRIRGLLEGGVDPASIGVLFRDLHPFGPMLEDVCRRFGIPVSYRRGIPLAASPLVRAILAPFAVIASRYGREELLGLVNSSYISPLRDRRGAPVSADAFEKVFIAAGYIDATLGKAEALIARRIAGLKRDGRPWELERRVLEALAPLLEEISGLDGKKPLAEFARLLELFIERHAVYRRGLEGGDGRALKRDASAVKLFQKVLRALEGDIRTLGMSTERLAAADFAALLLQGMEGEFLAGERQSGVAIMNFHDGRSLRFAHLFIGGLNEGIVPRRHETHPLFREREKLLLNRIRGEKLFRTAAEKAQEEPLLFHLALSCALETLTLSYSYADSRGNEQLRSPYLDEIISLTGLSEERIPVNLLTPEPENCLEREELLNTLAAGGWCSALLQGPQEMEGWEAVAVPLARICANAAIEGERGLFFAEEDPALRALLSTPYTGTLAREEIVREITEFFESPGGNTFSPTTLEEYGCCPFRLFLKRMVKLYPPERPGLEMAARDEGSLVHEILRSFFQRMRDEGRLPLTGSGEEQALMRETAERVFAAWEAEKYTGQSLLWEITKGRILAILHGVVEAEGKEDAPLLPRAFELEFAPLEVENDDGSRLFLAGKVDRVDVDAHGGTLRVVDYKMAGNGQRYGDLLKKEEMGETSFQMPLYLLAAAREMEREHGTPFTRLIARYWLLRKLHPLDKDFAAAKKEDFTGFFATDREERRPLGEGNFLNRVCRKVNAMKGGDFQITPRRCEFCDFRSVCRYVEVELKEG